MGTKNPVQVRLLVWLKVKIIKKRQFYTQKSLKMKTEEIF